MTDDMSIFGDDLRDATIDAIARTKARAKIRARAKSAADAKLRYIVPLLSFEKKNKPFVAACAVKVSINQRRFLFTAAHCIDRMNEEDLFFANAGAWHSVLGQSWSTDPPAKGDREDDELTRQSSPLILPWKV